MLIGLDGCKDDVHDHLTVNNSYTAISNGLKNHRAVMCAGDDGCITVYFDDAGKLHCMFDRFMHTESHAIFDHKYEIKSWVNVWKDRINNYHRFNRAEQKGQSHE